MWPRTIVLKIGIGHQVLILTLALIVFAAASAATLAGHMWQPPVAMRTPQSRSGSLNFHVNREAGALRLSWNGSALKQPRVGLLRIVDGMEMHEWALLPAQVTRSEMIYKPSCDQVRLDMEVLGEEGRSLRESVIAILPSKTIIESAGATPESPAAPALSRSNVVPKKDARFQPSPTHGRVDWSIHLVEVPAGSCEITAAPRSQVAQECAVPRLLTHLKREPPPRIRDLVQGDVQLDFLLTINNLGKVIKVKPLAAD